MDLNALAGTAGEFVNEHGDKVETAAEKLGDEGSAAPQAGQ